jgi:hypothetical protein
VTEHVRFKYACQACEGHVATSALPAHPIDKGRPGPGLLAQVIPGGYIVAGTVASPMGLEPVVVPGRPTTDPDARRARIGKCREWVRG